MSKFIPEQPTPEEFDRRQFVAVLGAAQNGFNTWAAKAHTENLLRLIDGTPIPNDLLVCVAEAVVQMLNEPQR